MAHHEKEVLGIASTHPHTYTLLRIFLAKHQVFTNYGHKRLPKCLPSFLDPFQSGYDQS